MADDLMSLIRDARLVANLHTDVHFARFLGISRRTVLRHHSEGGLSSGMDADKLIAAVSPLDPDLARRLAKALRRDLDALGLSAPAKPPQTADHSAAILLTASDAFGLLPRDARPALRLVLERIKDLGMDIDQLIALLAEPPKR